MNIPVITPVALYYTTDRKSVVLEGDKRAAFLIANAGQQIPQGDLKALGLLEEVKTKVLTAKDVDALVEKAQPVASAKAKNADPAGLTTR